MAERRGVAEAAVTAATMILLLLAFCVPPARPHPAPQHPPPARQLLTTTTSPGRQGGEESGWSLKDTLLRLDDLLQRHNDYNDVMLESGEEDDQLSRLLYRLQHGDRVREGWYEKEPTVPPLLPANQRLDTTTLYQRGRHEHRPESTGSSKRAARAPTQKEKKAKKTKGKKINGKKNK